MRTLLVAAGIALIGVGARLGYVSGQGTGSASSGALTAQDYADIQQLYWRYNHPPVPIICETTSLLRLVSGRGGFDG